AIRQGSSDLAPVFLFHPHGGTVLVYLDLIRNWPGSRPVWGLQSQGIAGEAVPAESIAAMARSYIAEIRAVQPHGPYHLDGYCLGDLLAWEVEQQLHAAVLQVGMVGLIHSYHPSDRKYYEGEVDLRNRINHLLDRLRLMGSDESGPGTSPRGFLRSAMGALR